MMTVAKAPSKICVICVQNKVLCYSKNKCLRFKIKALVAQKTTKICVICAICGLKNRRLLFKNAIFCVSAAEKSLSLHSSTNP